MFDFVAQELLLTNVKQAEDESDLPAKCPDVLLDESHEPGEVASTSTAITTAGTEDQHQEEGTAGHEKPL